MKKRMDKNEKVKKRVGPAFENDEKRIKPFGDFTPMQQERIITHMNTIGSKNEMRRMKDSLKNVDSGMIEIL